MIMHLPYWLDEDAARVGGKRREIIDSSLTTYSVKNRNGELIIFGRNDDLRKIPGRRRRPAQSARRCPLRIFFGGYDFAVAQVNDAVAVPGCLRVVCNHQHGLRQFAVRLAQHMQHDFRILRV